MFYSEAILSSKGPLAKVWLASHMEKKLTKAQFLQTDLGVSIVAIRGDGTLPMSLRLSGQLLLGVVRIYSRKARYLLEDCIDATVKLKMAFKSGLVDLPPEQLLANLGSITLNDAVSEFALLIPDPDFNTGSMVQGQQPGADSITSLPQDISLAEPFTLERSFSLLRQNDLGDFSMAEGGFDFGFDLFAPDNFRNGIEVARDAPVGDSPVLSIDGLRNASATITPKSLNLPGDLDAFPDVDPFMQDFGGDSVGPDLELEDSLGYPPNFDMGGEFMSPDGIIPSALARKLASQTRKRKLVVDEVTMLNKSQLAKQLKDTSDIVTEDSLLPAGKKPALEASFATAALEDYLNSKNSINLVPELQSMFEKVSLGDVELGQAIPDSFGNNDRSFTPGFFGEDSFALSIVDGFEPSGRRHISANLSLDGSEYEPSAFFEGLQAPSQQEAIDEDVLFSADVETPRIPTLAQTTLRAVELIKKDLESREETSQADEPEAALFTDIAGTNTEANRSDAVRLFFELLVLNTKNVIEVKQDKPYGELEIIPKPIFDEVAP